MLLSLPLLGSMKLIFWDDVRPYFWNDATCTIIESGRGTGGIRYRYEAEGKVRESTQVTTSKRLSIRDNERNFSAYPAGVQTACHVDPRNPDNAALRLGPLLFPAISLVLPLSFFVLGFSQWRTGRRADQPTRDIAVGETPADVQQDKNSDLVSVFVLLLFFLCGLGMLALAGRSVLTYFDAQSWPQMQCEITGSTVTTYTNKSKNTYGPNIIYHYQVGERDVYSSDYASVDKQTSDRGAVEAILARYPRGAEVPCYVNPVDPTQALLDRDSFWSWVLFGELVIGLSFAAVVIKVLVELVWDWLKGSAKGLP
ncbi:MAG: DUF3592 domain-containing protein [Pseudomonadales bacterium]|jgi:hypothetical protein|nr:DUF3592 domain-containing protein [Pseudomonadales bacterium]